MTETKNGAKYIDKDPPMEEGSQSLGRKILDYLAYLKETLNFIFSNYGRRLTDANGDINELHRTATETTSRLADTEGNVTQLTQRTDEIESTVSTIDTDMSGMQSQITQNASAITSEVSRATTAEGALSTRLGTAESRITQNADSISSEVSRATAAEGALSSSIAQTAGEVSIVAQKLDNIGGRNILLNSATVHWTALNGTTVSHTDGVSVSEWGCDDAIRATGTGGGSVVALQLWRTSQTASTLLADRKYVMSCWIKNNSAMTLRLAANNGTSDDIAPGERKRAVVYADGDGSSALRLRLATQQSGEAFDFIYWHPQIEYGEVVTSWNPAPEDAEAAIAANSAAIEVNSTAIASKVSQTDYNGNTIASLINQTATTIDIDASHINLNGAVTFSDLNSRTQDLINGKTDSSQVTTIIGNTVNAAYVNALEINAKKIVSTHSITWDHSNYTAADLDVIRALILANSWTDSDLAKYDFNLDGVITISDLIICRDMINDGTDYTASIKTEIDPSKPSHPIAIYCNNGLATYMAPGKVKAPAGYFGNAVYAGDKTYLSSNGTLNLYYNDTNVAILDTTHLVIGDYYNSKKHVTFDPDNGIDFINSSGNTEVKFGGIASASNTWGLQFNDSSGNMVLDIGRNGAINVPQKYRLGYYGSIGDNNGGFLDLFKNNTETYPAISVDGQAQEFVIRDTSNGRRRTVLDRTGLTFRDANDNVTAKYPAYGPAIVSTKTLTSSSSVKITFSRESVAIISAIGYLGNAYGVFLYTGYALGSARQHITKLLGDATVSMTINESDQSVTLSYTGNATMYVSALPLYGNPPTFS